MDEGFGAYLKGLRECRTQSLRRVAARAGVSPGTVGNWEAGRTHPRVPELTAVLAALEVSPSERQTAFLLADTPRTLLHLRKQMTFLPSGGDLLRALRLRRRLTIEQVAAHLAVRPSAVTRWEQSRAVPSDHHREALFTLLGMLAEEREAFGSGSLSPADTEPATLDTLMFRLEQLRAEIAIGQYLVVDLRFLALEADLWHLVQREPREAVWRALGLTYTWHAQWLLWRERLGEAGPLALRALRLVRRHCSPEPFWIRAVHVAANQMVDGTKRPRLAEGIDFLRGWMPLCHWPETTAWLCQNIATFAMRAGQIDYAIAMDTEAMHLVNRDKNARAIRNTRFDSAVIHLRKGDAETAHSLLSSETQPNAYHRIYEAQMWTETLLALGEKERAYERLTETYAILKEYGLSAQYAEPFAHWAIRWRSLF